MASLLMAIFVWFASLFGAAEQARPQGAAPAKVVANKAPAQPTEWAWVHAAAPAPGEPAMHIAGMLTPAAIDRAELRDVVVQVQDAQAAMREAMKDLQTIRVSAAGKCDRTLIIRGAKLRTPAPPTVPTPLSAGTRNS